MDKFEFKRRLREAVKQAAVRRRVLEVLYRPLDLLAEQYASIVSMEELPPSEYHGGILDRAYAARDGMSESGLLPATSDRDLVESVVWDSDFSRAREVMPDVLREALSHMRFD